MRAWLAVLLCMAWTAAPAQQAQDDTAAFLPDNADETAATVQDDAPLLQPVRVTAPRMSMDDVYRSKPPPQTPPTVFGQSWREPFNLKKIGDEGGVVPLLVNYTARKIAQGARKIPGWKGPHQPATARPSPLSEDQAQRALRLQEASPASP